MPDKGNPDKMREILAPIWSADGDGPRLAENRAPALDVAPWVATLVSIRAPADTGEMVSDGLCNDLVYVRYVFNGLWTTQTADGTRTFQNEALMFGQHSKFMPVDCEGDIMSAGMGLCAGAWHALTKTASADLTNRIVRNDLFGLMGEEFREELQADNTPERWNLALEEAVRRYVAKMQPDPPDPISTAFEAAAFADPMQSLHDFAESQNISLRKLERVVKRDFGVTPRAVMRRARAMDVAALLCGVSDQHEEDELMLRYFDQSHLIRDFTNYFGVTPRRFRDRPRPLLKVTLEQRQARRDKEEGRA